MNSDHHPDRHLETLEPGKKSRLLPLLEIKNFSLL